MEHYFKTVENLLAKVKALNIPFKIALFDC